MIFKIDVKTKNVFFVLSFLIISEHAYAYLDPGTGSMLIYFLIGIFATLGYSSKEFLYKLKSLILSGKTDVSLAKPENIDILFYSEGGHYWNVFWPIIEELGSKGIPCAYYTSDEQDPGLSSSIETLQAKYIGKSFSAFALLNRLEVKVVAMTTPQLDVLQLRRSSKVKHYVHIVHAPTDVLLYKKFAFDYFDSVFCSGPHQINSIRALEKVRELPEKKLFESGLTYYDVMKEKVEHKPNSTRNKKVVLVAPTWGNNGMLSRFGSEPIKKLLESGFDVTLRPHPQTFNSEKEILDKILKDLKPYGGLIIDKEKTPQKSINNSDILLSDISGIIFDYFFVFEKPVVVLTGHVTRDGFEAEDVDLPVWELEIVKEIATCVDKEDVSKLSDWTNQALEKHNTSMVEKHRASSLFHYGSAGKVSANQLLEILGEIK